MKSGSFELAIVIATRNRPDDLYRTLKSFEKSKYKNFKIYVVDSSDSENSEKVRSVVDEFSRNFLVEYIFSNPGSATQRNVGIERILTENDKCLGIVFFDDDIEVFEDSISVIVDSLGKFVGVGLNSVDLFETCSGRNIVAKIKRIYSNLFLCPIAFKEFGRRKILPSGWNVGFEPGLCEWLPGYAMAYRMEVFRRGFRFNVKLEKLGGYAHGEDAHFSYLVSRTIGQLFVPENGRLIHYKSPVNRYEVEKMLRVVIFNRYLIVRDFIKRGIFRRGNIFAFCWSILGIFLYHFSTGLLKGNCKQRMLGICRAVYDILTYSE